MIDHIFISKRKLSRWQKKKRIVKLIVWLIVIFSVTGLFLKLGKASSKIKAYNVEASLIPLEPIDTPIPTNTPTLTETPKQRQYNEVYKEIEAVFGNYTPIALKLLQDAACHENRYLDPKAKHKNDDKANSTDWGVFQINDHWQGVRNTAFLLDYKINIRMAWNIFERSGYSFKMWTCGKKLGI